MSTANNYEVLFIDLEGKNIVPSLEPLASRHGLHLLSTASIDEGIRLLETYRPILDAVVVTSKLAGASNLDDLHVQAIKAKGNDIPVLIFPSDDSDCLMTSSGQQPESYTQILHHEIGADPQHVFSQIRSAIELDRVTNAHDSSTFESSWDSRSGFYLQQKRDGECRALFAFPLQSVLALRSQLESATALRAAIRWHYHFLSLLTFFSFPLDVTLRIISPQVEGQKDKKLLISLIFSTTGSSYELATDNAKTLQDELQAHLSQSNDGLSHPYSFAPILDQLEFERIITPFPLQSVVNLERRTLKLGNPGHGLLRNAADNEEGIGLALPTGGSFSAPSPLNHICAVLSDQSSQSLLDITITPSKLLPSEIDLLHDMRNDLSQDAENVLSEEKESVIPFAQAMMEQAGQTFYLQSRLATAAPAVSGNLITAAAIDLFGQVSSVQVSQLNTDEGGILNPMSFQTTQPIVRLRHIFPLSHLVTIFHLPLPFQGDAPWINTTHPLDRFLPDNISTNGPVLGYKEAGKRQQLIRIAPEDLRRHLWILGQTGTGKSTTLMSMIKERIDSGAGVALIDPHADLWQKVYESIPKRRRDDVVVFDPTDLTNPPGLNLLEYDKRFPEQKTSLIDEMLKLFDEMYDLKSTGGPVFEMYMRNAMLLAMDDPSDPGTLLDVVRIFQDSDFRSQLLEKSTDQQVVNFWRIEAEKAGGELSLRNVAPYVTSKLTKFVQNHYLTPIVGQQHSTIDFREILDNRKILLVKLTKGKLGQLGARLLGTILFARLLMAALSREDTQEEKRADFTLFVDEFQDFVSDSLELMLSEVRKYRLSLVLANQALGQLRPSTLKTLFGNVGSYVFFRPGIDDATIMEPYVCPPFVKEELLNMPNFVAVARLMINNTPSFPFIMNTLSPEMLKRY